MFVRMKVGHAAGELRDIEPVSARAMLADGRAGMAFEDQLPPAEPVLAPAPEPPADTTRRGKKAAK